MADGTAPGLAYGVVRDGVLVHDGSRGVDRVGGAAPDSMSVFRIASMSKSFVAATVLSLRDEGRLALDAPVGTYVPELDGLTGPTSDSRLPTLRDLLTMSAGFITDDPYADRHESMSVDGFTDLLRDGFVFDETPGVRYDYSNLGYAILGRVISNVCGTPFQDAVTERVIRPLGLMSTGFRLDDVPAGRLALGHVRRDGRWEVEPTSSTGEFASIGGLFSTVADLARWVSMLCGAFPARDDHDPGVPLSRASLREMQQGHRFVSAVRGVPDDGELPGEVVLYGFGLQVTVHPRFGAIVWHSGGYPGYGSVMLWHPSSGTGLVTLANGRYGGPYRAAFTALASLLEAADAPARVARPSSAALAAGRRADALLDSWDDAVADELFAPNVDGDIPRARRRAEVAAAVAAVGGLEGPSYDVSTHGASHLQWWRRGPRGRVRVEIVLTPDRVQRLQTFDVRASVEPSRRLVEVAERVAASVISAGPSWPTGVVHDESVDVDALMAAGRRAHGAGVAATVSRDPALLVPDNLHQPEMSEHSAVFEADGADATARLVVAVDPASGSVTACRLVVTGKDWPTVVRSELPGDLT
jgi:CubicO group peptidase (beta-lactamase class C family)